MNKAMSIALCLSIPYCHAESMQQVFTSVFDRNFWGDPEGETFSGPGSSLKQTATMRAKLPGLFEEFGIKTMLDAACGDLNWMKELGYPFKSYIGIDIVPGLIKRNNELYHNEVYRFEHKNIVEDPLPQVDLIFCRDCLVHLHFNDIKKALRNFKASGTTYVLMTTFTRKKPNKDIKKIGQWRTLNMQLPPFNLPEPIAIINEACTEADKNNSFGDKCLGLWRLADINI